MQAKSFDVFPYVAVGGCCVIGVTNETASNYDGSETSIAICGVRLPITTARGFEISRSFPSGDKKWPPPKECWPPMSGVDLKTDECELFESTAAERRKKRHRINQLKLS